MTKCTVSTLSADAALTTNNLAAALAAARHACGQAQPLQFPGMWCQYE
jgi:hypothetical protein